MEDSKNALFVEPNAYINKFNRFENCEIKPIKKVVFSEPYDCMPNYYFNNHFEKGDCNCVPNKKSKDYHNHNQDKKFNCNTENYDCNCNQNSKCNNATNKNNLNFNLQSLMPLLSGFNKGGGLDFNSISSLFNSGGGFDFSKLLSNPDLIKSALNLFTGKKGKSKPKEEIICSDYEIKRYTKV